MVCGGGEVERRGRGHSVVDINQPPTRSHRRPTTSLYHSLFLCYHYPAFLSLRLYSPISLFSFLIFLHNHPHYCRVFFHSSLSIFRISSSFHSLFPILFPPSSLLRISSFPFLLGYSLTRAVLSLYIPSLSLLGSFSSLFVSSVLALFPITLVFHSPVSLSSYFHSFRV